MKILAENEFVIQKGRASQLAARIAMIAAFVACLLIAFVLLDYLKVIELGFGSFLSSSIRKALSFLLNDSEMALFLIAALLLVIAFGLMIVQIIFNTRRYVIITNQRLLVKQAGRKAVALPISEFDHINLKKKNLEIVAGNELYYIKNLGNASDISLIATWYIGLAKAAH